MPIDIRMPSLDPSMSEARVVKWLKAAGDPVEIGEPIVEIETDKAVVDVEAEAKGFFAKALVAEGSYAPVNSVIGIIMETGKGVTALQEVAAAPTKSAEERMPGLTPAEPPVSLEPRNLSEKEIPPSATRQFASPLARRLATLEGLDLTQLRGSGPNGRIVKGDIESALKAKSAQGVPCTRMQAEVPGREFSGLPDCEVFSNTSMRSSIARRLTESSREIPHYYLVLDCELDKLLALRQEVNAADHDGEKVSLNDFIIRAAALALKKVPAANAAWTESAILRFRQADISVAVSLDGGLITPVVRNADAKNLRQISAEARELAARARAGKLLPEEYKGGTFTISNLGMYGIKSFTSIINPPQGAILSVGAGEPRPVVKEGQLCVATVMTVTLAADHRCIDGAVGAEFLAAFKKLIEQPIALLF
ncbi:pyruvate dehydrogenase complex dihydrolipoamide acetyltransferase [Geoalkalibacter sp.]|uniref:pyruvate dehydrogenase complex dihydrolipoamide acetyltransferase n=1 Tax=Geoalkalibacter sp. TaxID=3041440 RepID=UPI00272DC80E|nr:pyruvate dehydrogenase complex dihydrolipoamide acetyltransferase [Geoalkalibacter sp.]